MRRIVQASVPYYLEGDRGGIQAVQAAGTRSTGGLWTAGSVPAAPRGWELEEWNYFQVQGALENALLLVALDMGVFSNQALAEDVRARAELDKRLDPDSEGAVIRSNTKPLP